MEIVYKFLYFQILYSLYRRAKKGNKSGKACAKKMTRFKLFLIIIFLHFYFFFFSFILPF